jgi:predicted adenine nucleotide alpha hydrolase (AANH) superfamily ATPase
MTDASNSILLHACCAPCTVYPLKRLREKGYDVAGYFTNPNIHPFREFEKRLNTALEFASASGLRLEADCNYGLDEFLAAVAGKTAGPDRCRACYGLRLGRAAGFAARNGYRAFTTTLLYSIYQKHDMIAQICEAECSKAGIEFLYVDFRSGWREGVIESKKLNQYRQAYCGCIFSEYERYHKPAKENP